MAHQRQHIWFTISTSKGGYYEILDSAKLNSASSIISLILFWLSPSSRLSPMRWYSNNYQHFTRSPSLFTLRHQTGIISVLLLPRHRFCSLNLHPDNVLVSPSIISALSFCPPSTALFSDTACTGFSLLTTLFRPMIKFIRRGTFAFAIVLQAYSCTIFIYSSNLCLFYITNFN